MDPRISHHHHARASTPPVFSSHQRQLSSTPSSNVFSKMSAVSQALDAPDAAPLPNTDHWTWKCCRCNNSNMGQPSEYGSCSRCMHERCLRCRIKWGGTAQWFGDGGGGGGGGEARKEDGSRKGEGKGKEKENRKGKMFFLGSDS